MNVDFSLHLNVQLRL